MNGKRIDYLIAVYKSSREELLFRIKHRDQWLKLQLFVQIILVSIASGIEIAGIKPNSPYPNILFLAAPSAFILYLLYFVEDRLIGLLSVHIGQVSLMEKALSLQKEIIENSDISEPMREYARKVLPARLVAQVFAFVLVPCFITSYYVISLHGRFFYVYSIGSIIMYVTLLLMLGISYKHRKTTGQAKNEPSQPD